MLYSRSLEVFQVATLKLYTCSTVPSHFPLPPASLAAIIVFSALWGSAVLKIPSSWNQAVFIPCDWVVSLSIVSSRFIHTLSHMADFLRLIKYSIRYITFSFICCWIFRLFLYLVIVNNAKELWKCIYLVEILTSLFWYMVPW